MYMYKDIYLYFIANEENFSIKQLHFYLWAFLIVKAVFYYTGHYLRAKALKK